MQGLRTRENEMFLKYFKKVQEKAYENDSVFFMDFGQCDDIEFQDMELDRLFGWLIPLDKSEEFEKMFLSLKVPSEWDQYCKWAIPKIDSEKLEIIFE